MKYLLFVLLWSGVVGQATPLLPDYRFSIVSGGESISIQPAGVESRFLNDDLPSCSVFRFRKKQMLKQAYEMDVLLERVGRNNGKWSANDRAEFEQLLSRQRRMEQELKSPAVEVSAYFEFPMAERGLEWIVSREYRLKVKTPTFSWVGFGPAGPDQVRIEASSMGWTISHKLFMTEYCESPLEIEVTLERL